MLIPIENIYYLLCYVWNKLEEKDRVSITIDDKTDILDLLAKVLVSGTKILLKRGIEKNYLTISQEIAGVKGKLELSETVKRGILKKQRTFCTMDEFSSNILSNQLLVSTFYRLINTQDLDPSLKGELKRLIWMFSGIQPIEIQNSHFRQVRLHRNNKFYGFLLNVCQLIYENSLPTEKPGEWRFIDFMRDEQKMNKLFETFLLNFYRKHLIGWQVSSPAITWQLIPEDEKAIEHLPRMLTDITLERQDEKIIIDAKYYRQTMTENFERQKIHSGNLYQIFSYLINQRGGDEKTRKTRGILLYPTIDEEYDLHYMFEEHPIQIKTVNLNQHWRGIEKRLVGVVGK